MQTRQNLPAILTVALLIATVGILFWYGNFKINKANNINSTIIAWENLDNTSQDLSLNIKNDTKQGKTYRIKWLLNKKIIDTSEVTISSETTKTISPTKKILTGLEELSNNNQAEILYQAKISWGKNPPQADQQAGKTETLGKWLRK